MAPNQLLREMPLLLEDLLFEFDNVSVRMVAVKKIPEMETSGLHLKGYDGNEAFTVNLWVGRELVESGLARFAEEEIGTSELGKIHYMERIQPLERLAPLPERFYQRIYLTLSDMRRRVRGDLARIEMYNRFVGMFRDILEGRVRKIVRLASFRTSTDQIRNFTPEERALYEELSSIILSWRSSMLSLVGE